MSMRYRIGILLLEQIAQVHHLASVAFELSKHQDIEVLVFGNARSLKLMEELSTSFPGHNCEFHVWKSRPIRAAIEKMKGRVIPRPKNLIENHWDSLQGLDLVLCSDFYGDHVLRLRGNSHKPLVAFGFHGAGDGAYGFKSQLGNYDYLLLSGEKVKQRLLERKVIRENQGLLVGYPKFDLVDLQPKLKFFDKDQPTVLYNPHFKADLSSWHLWGLKILDWFASHPEYNLIFAPHFNLFKKKRNSLQSAVLKSYSNCPNIRLDLGSYYSVDMSYTLNADLYLGDVSSQVYEFLVHPRPCVFLNAHGIEQWAEDENYKHWHYGQVVDDLDQLESALKSGLQNNKHLEVQTKGMEETFYAMDGKAGKRAAEALLDVLKNEG